VFYEEATLGALVDTLAKSMDRDAATERAKYMLSRHNYVVVGGNEKNTIHAFLEVARRMSPDIITAFNGGKFDWPMIRAKLKYHGLLMEFKRCFSSEPISTYGKYADTEALVYTKCFRTATIKISAEETQEILTLNMHGVIDTDCMIVFKQLNPASEVGPKASLNFFLSKYKLGSKEDMPYQRMFAIYEAARRLERMRVAIMNGDEGALVEAVGSADENAILAAAASLERDMVQSRADMALVAKYCVIDAFRCQQLYVKCTIVPDRRELSNLASLDVYSSWYKANGMKVRNIVGQYCHKLGYSFSNATQHNRKVKYAGAYVFTPVKGLNTHVPVASLDASSLYPSIMMAYNLSPDKVIDHDGEESERRVDDLRSRGYVVREVSFGGRIKEKDAIDDGTPVTISGWVVHHSSVLKDGDVARVLNLEKSTFERAHYDERAALPGEKMGIFPMILKILFDKRVELKKPYNALNKLIEKIGAGKEALVEKDFADTGFTLEAYNSGACTMSDLSFFFNKYESKQKALKVIMNTFYGEQGNYLSSIYKLVVAGGITSYGQETIKCVSAFLRSNDYKLWYGDTDSNYISCPERMFTRVRGIYASYEQRFKDHIGDIPRLRTIPGDTQKEWAALIGGTMAAYGQRYEADEKLFMTKAITLQEFDERNFVVYEEFCAAIEKIASAQSKVESIDEPGALSDISMKMRHIWALARWRIKEELWAIMVQMTRRDIEVVKGRVNSRIELLSGTRYISMAYEEVLFALDFLGKKKYFGYAHLGKENFHPDEKGMFVRGIDIVKQGQSALAKEIGYGLIKEMCSVENELTEMELVKEKLQTIYTAKYDLRYFVLSGKYKPLKKNVAVQSFVARMASEYKTRSNPQSARYSPETAALYTPPTPGDQFKYVIVKRAATHHISGKKIEYKKGDVMEFVDVYLASQKTKEPLEIDLDYYMKGAIIGLFARFISYLPEFAPPTPIDSDKRLDEYCVKRAKEYIEDYCRSITGRDTKDANKKRGVQYRNFFKQINIEVVDRVRSTMGGAATHMLFDFELKGAPNEEDDNAFTAMKPEKLVDANFSDIDAATTLASDAKSEIAFVMQRHREREAADKNYIYKAVARYKSANVHRLHYIDEKIAEVRKEIRAMLPGVMKIKSDFENDLMHTIETARDQQADDRHDVVTSTIGEFIAARTGESAPLTRFADLITEWTALKKVRNLMSGVYIALAEYRNKKIKLVEQVVVSREEIFNSRYEVN
jgi:DNA polymerase elongation subunit (family B)